MTLQSPACTFMKRERNKIKSVNVYRIPQPQKAAVTLKATAFERKENSQPLYVLAPFLGGKVPTQVCTSQQQQTAVVPRIYNAELAVCRRMNSLPLFTRKSVDSENKINYVYVIKIKLLPPTKVSVKPCIVQENIEHWNSAAHCQPHEN